MEIIGWLSAHIYDELLNEVKSPVTQVLQRAAVLFHACMRYILAKYLSRPVG